MDKLSYDGPIVLAVLDGVGLAPDSPSNAVSRARTPFLGMASRDYLHLALEASGEAVGLTTGQMGNSEVGHNTMGTGQAVKQGVAKVNEVFASGEVFNSEAWREALSKARAGKTLHFAGIFSDGGVHSDIYYLEQMIDEAYREGARKIRVHAVLDGRDVGPYTAARYIERFENFALNYPDADIKIADGGGRMVFVADRYENDWGVVATGWNAIMHGEAEYYFKSAKEAIEDLRRITTNIQDQYLPAFVITDAKGWPVGKVEKGDVFIYFDFRADRAIEIAQAFTYWDFPYFDRGDYKPTDVYFIGMTEYNSDTHVPEHRLIEPPEFHDSLSEFLGSRGISQLACSETVKFGHITYYFNGNSYEKAPREDFVEIESYTEPFETRPWMKSAELTDEVLRQMSNYNFVRVNYPGGDMVGHTADVSATIVAMEAIDLSLKRLADAMDKLGGALIIVADHGNAEELLDEHGDKKTAHTTNKVPFIIYDNTENRNKYSLAPVEHPGLKNLAATIATLLGQTDFPDSWAKPLIRL